MITLPRTLSVLTLCALPTVCLAAENMQFTGTLLAPPVCTISDKGGRIDVRFEQNIAINRIDGEQYRQAIPYQVECPGVENTSFNWRIRFTLIGADAGFDLKALETSVPGLGIRVSLGDTPLVPNLPLEVSLQGEAPPTLEAVPVKEIGVQLPSIPFTASALLIAELY